VDDHCEEGYGEEGNEDVRGERVGNDDGEEAFGEKGDEEEFGGRAGLLAGIQAGSGNESGGEG